MTRTESTCTWDSDHGWLTDENRPCPKSHCAMRGRCNNHLGVDELTCPKCVGSVRRDLAHIGQRYEDLPEQAQERGIQHAALSLAGPAALEVPGAPLDDVHPLLVLGRWDMLLREDYDQPTSLKLTVPRAKDFLDKNLTRMANDPDQDFELFAREIGACRAHIETVLDDSRQPDKGAPCPTCSDKAKGAPVGPGGKKPKAPRLEKHWGKERAGDDKWQCPREREHWWTDEDYRKFVGSRYLDHAETLTASQLAEHYRVKESNVRRWANGWTSRGVWHDPTVRKAGYDGQRRQLYVVADVLEARAKSEELDRGSIAS